ncbi:hypothetical protein GCM10009663_56280 [Kitasatospora arboriphila]|uniref:Uncharacterized protein n=1 Tax=Kitasatospora arboriphila TaxID=258052 RepID=A0ABP4EFT4_9ACTN
MVAPYSSGASIVVVSVHADRTPRDTGKPSLFRRLRRVVRRSPVKRDWARGGDLQLSQRAPGFAALGFLTLVPLLIVVAAADPDRGRGFAQWLGDGLGVSPASRREVERLLGRPRPGVPDDDGLRSRGPGGVRPVVRRLGAERLRESLEPARPAGGTCCGSPF